MSVVELNIPENSSDGMAMEIFPRKEAIAQLTRALLLSRDVDFADVQAANISWALRSPSAQLRHWLHM